MRAAWVVIVVALVFASGCARPDWIESTLVTVDVTGVWQGTSASSATGTFAAGRPIVVTLEQSGSRVKGQITVMSSSDGNLNGPIEGTISGDIFSFHDSRGRVTGQLQVSGDEMTGTGTISSFSGTITLHRLP
jgi:uncharacterized protein YdeI (BOF family)